MNVIIAKSEDDVFERAISVVSHHLTRNPCSTLGLGLDPVLLRLYGKIAKHSKTCHIPLRHVKAFCAEELLGKTNFDASSRISLLRQEFLNAIQINPRCSFSPSHEAGDDPLETAAKYEALIDSYGGIDLQVLSLDADGAFSGNKPGGSFSSQTHLTKDEKTGAVKISFGLRTIRQSGQILLVITGAEKADAVKAMLENPVSTATPASSLQFHRKTTVILDGAAASRLSNPEKFGKSFHGRLQLVRSGEASLISKPHLALMDSIQDKKTTSPQRD